MLIDKKNKFVFIYFQKTASKYVRRILEPLGGFCTAELYAKGIDGYIKNQKYMKSNNIIHDLSFDFSDFFVFGVIRNPFEWYMSLYVYSKEWQHLDEHRLFGFLPKMSFQQFMSGALNGIDFFKTRSDQHRNDNCIRLFKVVRNGKLDAGWLTYKYIYTYFLDWERIISTMSLEEFKEKHDQLLSTKMYTIESLNEEMPKILDHLDLTDKIDKSFLSAHNVNHYDRNRDAWYTEELKAKILKKDSLLFELYYKEEL